MTDIAELKARLALPVVVAPMFIVSGPELLLASCRAGLVGSVAAATTRSIEQLEGWLQAITKGLAEAGDETAPWALNLIVHEAHNPLFPQQIPLLERYRPPIVITSLGQPTDVAARVHDYGGLVFHDVVSMRHAAKAASAGVDGLIAVTAGAGGHCGALNPFTFVPQLREVFGGAILLGGGIGDGKGILAAEALGADFAYMGTRFLATKESSAPEEYKLMTTMQDSSDIIVSDRITGIPATFMRAALERAGLDPDALPPLRGPRQPDLPEGVKPWRDAWTAGHVVGLIHDVPTVADLTARLQREYDEAHARMCSAG